MLAVFGRAFEDRESYLGRQPDDAYLAGLLRSPTFIALYTKLGIREDVLHFDIPVTRS